MRVGIGIGLNYQRPSSGGAPPPSLILDSLSAGFAASTRQLKTGVTAAMKVRRDTDNTTTDIGFVAGELDETALLAFSPVGSAFIDTWYDQSGNARHVTNATTTQQPRIVNAGTIELQNSKPSIFFNGTSHHLFNSSPFMYAAGAASVCAVASGSTTSGGSNLVGESSTLTNNPAYWHGQQQGVTSDPDSAAFYRNDTGTTFVPISVAILNGVWDNVLRPVQWIDTGSSVNVFRNGASGTAQAYTRSGALTPNRFAVGAGMRTTTGFFFQGYVSEVIIFASALSTIDRNTLDGNQSAAFPI